MSTPQERLADLLRKHPPVPAPHFNAPPPMVMHQDARLRGVVLQQARVSTERGTGNTLLTVPFKQQFGPMPLVAVLRYSSTGASLTAAHSKASQLRVGTVVQVAGEGLQLITWQRQPALEVLLVHSIEPPLEVNTRKDLE